MKYFLVAGEASGDLHASNLMAALKERDAQAEFRFLGGDLMQAVGGMPVKHYREMAYMGVLPVLLHARTILRNLECCCEAIRTYQPDVVILVDYPGFNLKIARFVKTQCRIPVHYYISPKIWAWKKYRIRSFRRYVDRMFCIFPFEETFYQSLNYPVDYVGNPSVDSVAAYREKQRDGKDDFPKDSGPGEKPLLAILAGSRRQEIRDNLPAMLDAAASFPEYQCVIAGAPGLETADYAKFMKREVPVVFGRTYALLEHSHAALVTSGTATLEAALFRVPQAVCYYFPGGRLVNFIYRHFFHVPYISLVNLIGGREIVQELFGAKFSRRHIHAELKRLLCEPAYRRQMLEGYDEIIRQLGPSGASQRTASLIVEALNALSSRQQAIAETAHEASN
ncbi:MAG: lipid-A-disaccharide synthase [Tannerella sp.]|jgi:lipid-A-disaccharide synthase|nr:lipid-A-disaccharide synthase [Tannerella sp.]